MDAQTPEQRPERCVLFLSSNSPRDESGLFFPLAVQITNGGIVAIRLLDAPTGRQDRVNKRQKLQFEKEIKKDSVVL